MLYTPGVTACTVEVTVHQVARRPSLHSEESFALASKVTEHAKSINKAEATPQIATIAPIHRAYTFVTRYH